MLAEKNIAMTEYGKTRIQRKNQAIIFEAALDVFSSFGFRGATLDQIASTAGLSKPNLLYYYPSKEAIHSAVLEKLLHTWLAPLRELNENGDPVEEIMIYVINKLHAARDFPRESRLFANEIVQGAPRIKSILETDLRHLVKEKTQILSKWIKQGRLAKIDPYHLIFSIWSLTQHYADFDVQVQAVTGQATSFDEAEVFLNHLYRRMLTP
ncbi:MAG: TetR family transcriptional regulator C-terminal domain-containing protein [Planktomarina sp.]|nr:TetR family transcriptional regulator C-terminal domain-containing protein [Planktomarina sp.]